jgi:signal-transduction protein with cAMP-binding, CBS, and nucleotidyltransferase domain
LGDRIGRTPVSEVMTKEVIIGGLEDELNDIMNLMTDNRMRHVPILENGMLQGMISIGDVVKAELHASQVQVKYLTDFMQGA